MADVQVENGFTRVANQILEEITKRKFNGTEFRIIMTVWRYTYGFQRKDHHLSNKFIAESIQIEPARVQKTLKKLIECNVILVTEPATYSQSRKLSFNKNYEEWGVEKEGRGQKQPLPVKKTPQEGLKITPREGSKNTPKKDSTKYIYKDNKEEESKDPIIESLIQNKIISLAEITPTLTDDINDVTTAFGFDDPEEMIMAAIKDAVRGNGRTWKFIYNKLNLWRKQGIKNLNDLQEKEGSNNVTRIHGRRSGNASRDREGKSAEQVLREAEESKRAIYGR